MLTKEQVTDGYRYLPNGQLVKYCPYCQSKVIENNITICGDCYRLRYPDEEEE